MSISKQGKQEMIVIQGGVRLIKNILNFNRQSSELIGRFFCFNTSQGDTFR